MGNLWFLWEIALTGEALMIITPTAEECSQAVLGIMSLISPITYNGDFRPYFTIYDSDFKHFSDLHDRKMLSSLILGVTNPFFLKTLPNMPNVLIINNDSICNTNSNTNNNSGMVSNSPSSVNSNNDIMSSGNGNNSGNNINNNNNNRKSKSKNKNNKNRKKHASTNDIDESKESATYNMGDITATTDVAEDGFVHVSTPVSETPKSKSQSLSNSLASPHASMTLTAENLVTVHVRQQSKVCLTCFVTGRQ